MKPAPTAPKAPKVTKPAKAVVASDEAAVATSEEEAASVASEETTDEASVADEPAAKPAPEVENHKKPVKAKVTTVQGQRADLGEVTIRQPDNNQVDVSNVDKEDLVLITMHETIDPAPRVGTFDCRHRLGVQSLIAKKNYRVPKFVAEVIVDANKGTYLSIEG